MREKIIKILKEIDADYDYEIQTSMFDEGILDSLAVVEIVTALEDRFGVEIDADDIIGENFNSIDTIIRLVEKSK